MRRVFQSLLLFGTAGLAAVEPVVDEKGYMVNADEVLAAPPVNDARIGMVNGALGVILNGEPFGSCGFSSILQRNLSDKDIADMMEHTGFRLNYLSICLGEEMIYPHGLDYGSTWLGEKTFDWTPVDRELARIRRFAPSTRIILKVDLNGAKWWTALHPEDAADAATGQADYLSVQWKRDARDAVRQMIAHIQSSPYADMVIGYALFNGATLDCSWPMNPETPEMRRRFREFLNEKYPTDAELQSAWRLPEVTLDNATVSLVRDPGQPNPFPLLHSPHDQARMGDSREFVNAAWQELLVDFARDVKEATQGRALVGVRTGNLLYGRWVGGPDAPYGSDEVNRLLESPHIDYFDQWANAFGRVVGEGDHGGPVMPATGLKHYGKMVFLQNDTPTHQSWDPGYGATADLTDTVAMQRRIFAHALTQEMYPYFWQMSSNFNVPEMMPEYRKMEEILRKSLKLDRTADRALAVVVDRNLAWSLGRDTEIRGPSRAMQIMDYPRLEWGRAGVGFDMIYLDHLECLPAYPVYLFFNTIRLNAADITRIHAKLSERGSVGIFVWADGFIDGEGRFSLENSRGLTGMALKLEKVPETWDIRPAPLLTRQGVRPEAQLGNSPLYFSDAYPNERDRVFPPYLVIDDDAVIPWGVHASSGRILLGARDMGSWKSIYSSSAIVSPAVLRLAVEWAGAFQYLESDDALYLNNSFIGVHARTGTREIRINLPEASGLYDVFEDEEFAPAAAFQIPIAPGGTRLFFRGSRETWEAL